MKEAKLKASLLSLLCLYRMLGCGLKWSNTSDGISLGYYKW